MAQSAMLYTNMHEYGPISDVVHKYIRIWPNQRCCTWIWPNQLIMKIC